METLYEKDFIIIAHIALNIRTNEPELLERITKVYLPSIPLEGNIQKY